MRKGMNETARRIRILGHPVRLGLLRLLARGERLCVCDLAARLRVGQPTLSRHLHALIESGLVARKREGTKVFYRVKINQERILLDRLEDIFFQPEDKKEETK